MIDLETVDTLPTAGILSIGAVEFDENEILDEFYQPVNVDSCYDLGLTKSEDTLKWWTNQSSTAKAVFTDPNRIHLKQALLGFIEWLPNDIGNLKIWAHGSDFDTPIIINAFNACGLKAPWNFWNHRCNRTVSAITGRRHSSRGVYHNALDDARSQAQHLLCVAPDFIR